MVMIIFIAHMDFLGDPAAPNVFNRFFQNAAVAVDYFFILSGFGLAISCRRSPEKLPAPWSLSSGFLYARGRVAKLYRLYIITMACAIPVSILEKVYRGQSVSAALIKTGMSIIIAPTLLQSASGLLSMSHCLNGVAWFLSALFILYIFHPLLEKLNQKIVNHDLTISALVITFGLSCLAHNGFLRIESAFSPGGLTLDLAHGSPYMRIFHFFTGMLLGDIYMERTASRGYITGKKATLLEAASLIFALLTTLLGNALFTGHLTEIKNALYLLSAMAIVYVFAICRGKLNHILTKRLPVFLGSLAMYIFLIHYVIRQTIGIVVYEYLEPSPLLNAAVTLSIAILTAFFTFLVYRSQNMRDKKPST